MGERTVILRLARKVEQLEKEVEPYREIRITVKTLMRVVALLTAIAGLVVAVKGAME